MKKDTYFKKVDAIRKKAAMSKPVGQVLDSTVGKTGVKIGDTVIKGVKTPGKILKKQWDKNQAFRNKNSTREKFERNSK